MARVIFKHGVSTQETRSVKHYCTINDILYTSVPIDKLTMYEEDLKLGYMPVGSVEFVKRALDIIGEYPVFNTYDDRIKPFLGRRVWIAPAYDILYNRAPLFVKPIETKRFTGFVLRSIHDTDYSDHDKDQLAVFKDYKLDEKLYASAVIDIVAEWRVYVLKGQLVAVCRYDWHIDDYEAPYELIMRVVDLFPGETLAIDVGLKCEGDAKLTPIAVELNDAWAVGKYIGISDIHYYRFLRTRWDEIIGGST